MVRVLILVAFFFIRLGMAQETATKTVNILPMAVDAILERKNVSDGTTFQDAYTSRSGSWYIGIVVQDNDFNDVLKDDISAKQQTTIFLGKKS